MGKETDSALQYIESDNINFKGKPATINMKFYLMREILMLILIKQFLMSEILVSHLMPIKIITTRVDLR